MQIIRIHMIRDMYNLDICNLTSAVDGVEPFEWTYLTKRRRVYYEGVYAIKAYPQTEITRKYLRDNVKHKDIVLRWLKLEVKALLVKYPALQDPFYLSLVFKIMYQGISGKQFRSTVRDFFGVQIAQHFLHELECFCDSKLDWMQYDKVVSYDWREKTNTENVDSISVGEFHNITESGNDEKPGTECANAHNNDATASFAKCVSDTVRLPAVSELDGHNIRVSRNMKRSHHGSVVNTSADTKIQNACSDEKPGTRYTNANNNKIKYTGDDEKPGTGYANALNNKIQNTGDYEKPGTGYANAHNNKIQNTGNDKKPGTGYANAHNNKIQYAGNDKKPGTVCANAHNNKIQYAGNDKIPETVYANAHNNKIQNTGKDEKPGTGYVNAQSNTIQNSGNAEKLGTEYTNAHSNDSTSSLINCDVSIKMKELSEHSQSKNKCRRIPGLLNAIPKTATRRNNGMPVIGNGRSIHCQQSKKCCNVTGKQSSIAASTSEASGSTEPYNRNFNRANYNDSDFMAFFDSNMSTNLPSARHNVIDSNGDADVDSHAENKRRRVERIPKTAARKNNGISSIGSVRSMYRQQSNFRISTGKFQHQSSSAESTSRYSCLTETYNGYFYSYLMYKADFCSGFSSDSNLSIDLSNGRPNAVDCNSDVNELTKSYICNAS